MSELFNTIAASKKTVQPEDNASYTADDIEVLEGLEPVRKRPGMYIGGTDERALHHLVAEILDNSMDEVVAGHASEISFSCEEDGFITISDNGRGIPIDNHPKFPGLTALEVIFTTLHSGGKFSGKAYQTSGGLHGVGLSVVNALSEELIVEVIRDKKLWRQKYSRGVPLTSLTFIEETKKARGTKVSFKADAEIFGTLSFKPATLYAMVRSKAYLFKGVKLHWSCAPSLLKEGSPIPEKHTFYFKQGIEDFLTQSIEGIPQVIPSPFVGEATFANQQGRIEWALSWCLEEDGFFYSYCNTIPTSQGGTHESGFKQAITRSLKAYGELVGNKKAASLTTEDVMSGVAGVISVFIKEPQFQGQTKEKLSSPEVVKLVDGTLKDLVDHWLVASPEVANSLLSYVIEKAEERLKRRADKELSRKTITGRLRLPGKLADCSRQTAKGTEIFIVEGDSAGGSAKQARDRVTQAVLPLRGKVLNVASATGEKLRANQQLSDLVQALGCGAGKNYSSEKLRYERIIIMTDADVDGAHIAALLMTFFYLEMRPLIEEGHLYLAQPPLYRVTQGGKSHYVHTDEEKDQLLKKALKSKGKVEISRFKGLGEMPAQQLKETTMDPQKRILIQLTLDTIEPLLADLAAINEEESGEVFVEKLMGQKPEFRYAFIKENATFVEDLDV